MAYTSTTFNQPIGDGSKGHSSRTVLDASYAGPFNGDGSGYTLGIAYDRFKRSGPHSGDTGGSVEAGSGRIDDGGYLFGLINRNYQDAPALGSPDGRTSVDSIVGDRAHGRPGTSWSPTIRSPGDGNGLDASAIGPVDNDKMLIAKGAGGFGIGNGLASPSTTVPEPRITLSTLTPGIGSGATFRRRGTF